ncbi:hypothetical protein MSMEI_4638 [Mycolicibacterium smegmatis MC2 155]|uniref:Uncharacterized protein n=1 Tax=Mycolicibacterium smegmatis (strain ATCC 700084 / mc(2)155) TaxID=246196 RepID=I7G5Y8_MYCS2|nr:hypothetical protein MSMEI_4638 [Mycolicibacterium smegmatis MC2 155]
MGESDTADRFGSHAAGAPTERGRRSHVAAGGSCGARLKTSIDDDPGLRAVRMPGRSVSAGHRRGARERRVAACVDARTLEKALRDGPRSCLRQCNRGSPRS